MIKINVKEVGVGREVNPYTDATYDRTEAINFHKWREAEHPPLPALDTEGNKLPIGEYEVDLQKQEFNSFTNKWQHHPGGANYFWGQRIVYIASVAPKKEVGICIVCDENICNKSFCADCGLNKADERKIENTMSIKDFKTAYEKLESEKIIAVQIAHVYEYGYWKSYTASVYRVVSITPKEINLQNVNYKNEWLTLNSKNLQSGQFKIEY